MKYVVILFSIMILSIQTKTYAELKEECIGFRADGSYYDKCRAEQFEREFAQDAQKLQRAWNKQHGYE